MWYASRLKRFDIDLIVYQWLIFDLTAKKYIYIVSSSVYSWSWLYNRISHWQRFCPIISSVCILFLMRCKHTHTICTFVIRRSCFSANDTQKWKLYCISVSSYYLYRVFWHTKVFVCVIKWNCSFIKRFVVWLNFSHT